MSRIKQLPPADWELYYRSHNHGIWKFFVSVGIPPHRARDLSHEVWARLIDRWRDGAFAEIKMPGLAQKQAEYLAWRYLRRSRRLSFSNVVELSDRRTARLMEDGELKFVSRETLQHVLREVGQCRKTLRLVFEKTYSPPCLTPAEVAAELGCSTEYVHQCLAELRNRLRELS